MKFSRVILGASLVANLALAALLVRQSVASSRERDRATALATAVQPGPSRSESPDDALRAALESGDAAALAKAGVSPEVVRALAVGRAFDKFQTTLRALRPPPSPEKYWHRPEPPNQAAEREFRRAASKAEREFSYAMEAATGADIESLFNGKPPRYEFLPAAKQEQLRRIERDYAELESQVELEMENAQLPADKERLRLLRLEKERDIAAALTPEQREQFELHLSRTAENVRGAYGELIRSEEEYRRIFALQKAYNDQFTNPNQDGPPSPETKKAQREAQQKLMDDIHAALDPEQVAAFQRLHDQDRVTLEALAIRVPVPANALETVLAARETYAARSMQISADTSLSVEQRRSQLEALAKQAQSELQKTLGSEGVSAFAQGSQWMNMLKGGRAFSTNPADAVVGTRGVSDTIFSVAPPPPRAAPVSKKD